MSHEHKNGDKYLIKELKARTTSSATKLKASKTTTSKITKLKKETKKP
jgi:hypothetical protein